LTKYELISQTYLYKVFQDDKFNRDRTNYRFSKRVGLGIFEAIGKSIGFWVTSSTRRQFTTNQGGRNQDE
jgi:hypothetical protein